MTCGDGRQRLVDLLMIDLAVIRQLITSRLSHEQVLPDQALKRSNVPTNDRMINLQFLAGLPYAPKPTHGLERPQCRQRR